MLCKSLLCTLLYLFNIGLNYDLVLSFVNTFKGVQVLDLWATLKIAFNLTKRLTYLRFTR